MRRPLAAALLCAIFAVAIVAQNSAPDFSGTWMLNLAKSKLAKHSDIASQTLTITCSGSSVTMRFTTNGKERSPRAYLVDGKEHPYLESKDGESLRRTAWKKSALVVDDFARVRAPNSPVDGTEIFHVTDRWTLSPDAHTLTDESSGIDHRTVLVYGKVEWQK